MYIFDFDPRYDPIQAMFLVVQDHHTMSAGRTSLVGWNGRLTALTLIASMDELRSTGLLIRVENYDICIAS